MYNIEGTLAGLSRDAQAAERSPAGSLTESTPTRRLMVLPLRERVRALGRLRLYAAQQDDGDTVLSTCMHFLDHS